MSAVIISPGFGDSESIRSAQISNAVFARAMNLGYGQVVAHALAKQAKREAADWETPNEVAMRIVRPRSHSATVPHSPAPRGAA